MIGYAWGQLRKALATADGPADPATRKRASLKADAWLRVLAGMATGRVRVGSPTPVRDFPAWLTPEIVRGGFATGSAAAAGPLAADEIELAERVGVLATRASLFAWFLSDEGLRDLERLLDTGQYKLWLPEHGALLTVAHLLRLGRVGAAESLLRKLEPWAQDVRFWPYPSAASEQPGVHVATVPDVAARLASKRPRRQVETEREALAIWLPFTDRVLAHWMETRSPADEIGLNYPDGWIENAVALDNEYRELASAHTKTTKHADPKGNLQSLLRGMRQVVEGDLDSGALRRVQGTVSAMVTKRGAPGSAQLLSLRETQSRIAETPSHASLAHEAAATLHAVGISDATEDPAALLHGLPASALPSVRAAVEQATHAPLEVLLRRGIVRSAESLAELAPQLTAETVAARYSDPIAGMLAKRTYRAFANRRSVLLTNHRTQVTISAIPWFESLEQSSVRAKGVTLAYAQALELASLAMRHFPGTLLPNSLIRELNRLFAIADANVPLTYEVAADIFMGSFSPVYQRAAQEASTLVADTIYARYYDIESDSIARFTTHVEEGRWPGARSRTSVPQFDALVHARAGVAPMSWGYNVAANGRVIEQAQILTTHNLAQLVRAGVQLDWTAQARGAWNATREHLAKTSGSKPLHHRKNAAFAWRQTVFYLSLASRDELDEFLADASLRRGTSADVAIWCRQILGGLRASVDATAYEPDPFLGWTTTGGRG